MPSHVGTLPTYGEIIDLLDEAEKNDNPQELMVRRFKEQFPFVSAVRTDSIPLQ